MATNERRRLRYQTDETYRERRLRAVQDARKAQRAGREKIKRMRGWQDIVQAPDSEVILIYDPKIFWPIVASLKDGQWKCVHYDGMPPRPTHWRYLDKVPV